MKCLDYHAAVAAKVRGTWNLHHEAQSQSTPLQFFTLLSSISGIVGSGGQANYAAGNAFLDAFAAYRHGLGLCAHSIDLGVIEEVGYMSKHIKTAERMEGRNGLVGIDERTLHKIVTMSILQQTEPIETQSRTQMITGLPLPLRKGSQLLGDSRFCTLRHDHEDDNPTTTYNANSIIALLQQMLHAKVDQGTVTMEVVRLINDQVVRNLGLAEAIEPAKSLNSYGIDSLAAVDLRNWLRTQLKVDLSTLDILHAKSLLDLAGKVTGSLRNEG
jgi:acyl carrier protein